MSAPDPLLLPIPDGCVVHTGVDELGAGTSVESACGTRRYRLSRTWDPDRPRIAWCLLNPSTASAGAADQTLRRVVGFSVAWGFGSAEVVNLFSLRSTDPQGLVGHDDPEGPHADEAIDRAVAGADRVVLAWGSGGWYRGRGSSVVDRLAAAGVAAQCLGVTVNGQPRHPLYLAGITEPADYRSASANAGWAS